MEALPATRIKELFEKYYEMSPWGGWHRSFLAEVQFFKGLSDEEFVKPENQEKLWRAKEVSTIGPGESVNVKGAYTDSDIANQLLIIRNKVWPEDSRKRAKAINDAYDQIMGLVQNRYCPTQRPLAKQSRLFTILIIDELHTCYKWDARKRLQELVLGSEKFQITEGDVLVRARLREILGKEVNLEESIWRAMFCWWLYENYTTIKRGDDPVASHPTSPAVEGAEDVIEKLDIWPALKQRKGLQAIANYHEALRMVIAAAQGGASPDDIVETMQSNPEFSSYKAKSCRAVFNLVRTFGFLENRDGLWYPSTDGEQLVEDDPADVLVEKLLIQVYGMAHLLKQIGDAQPLPKKAIYDFLKGLWPGWTSDFMPSALVAWLRALGLVSSDGSGLCALTDYGGYWYKKLPAREDIPKSLLQIVDVDVLVEDEPEAGVIENFEDVPFDLIWQSFQDDNELKRFVFGRDQVETLHLAWHCNPQKRFVLLSGLSGTGKTALLSHYARIYCKLKSIEIKTHRAIIAVSPDWRDPSGLLGYFNALHADPTFQAEPALRTVIAAARNPGLPYFLILDEMNLARVERYFAPFLSSMETGERLFLHAHDETVNDVPPSIPWPKNLFVGGTVNMDETTHPFSDKVLDRAFTLEFWDVRLGEFFEGRAVSNGGMRLTQIEDLLQQVNGHLFKVRRHFGYRTAGEILDFLGMIDGISTQEDPRLWNLADHAFFSKILPRIRGEESPTLHEVLKDILTLCNQKGMNQCAKKVEGMQERLKATGVTRFWS